MPIGVVAPFSPMKILYLVLWLISNETMKVILKATIDDFSLTIGLWVIGISSRQSGTLKLKELLPKIAHKEGITV